MVYRVFEEERAEHLKSLLREDWAGDYRTPLTIDYRLAGTVEVRVTGPLKPITREDRVLDHTLSEWKELWAKAPAELKGRIVAEMGRLDGNR